jgi:YbbR domain-containing protein
MLREFFIKDWGWKAFSLLLAVAIWLTVHKIIEEPKAAATDGTATYDNLPVEIVSARADVRDYRLALATVKVTVVGTPEVIALLRPDQLHATVDLTADLAAGKDSRRRVDVATPPGVTLLSVEPREIGVILPPRH